jgi:hypothetical protein
LSLSLFLILPVTQENFPPILKVQQVDRNRYICDTYFFWSPSQLRWSNQLILCFPSSSIYHDIVFLICYLLFSPFASVYRSEAEVHLVFHRLSPWIYFSCPSHFMCFFTRCTKV